MLTFITHTEAPPKEVRVNFGVFAGRNVTAAEIDELAHALLPELGQVTIVAEDRHDISETSEISLHQVRIGLEDDADAEHVARLVGEWAEACIADRHAEVAEL